MVISCFYGSASKTHLVNVVSKVELEVSGASSNNNKYTGELNCVEHFTRIATSFVEIIIIIIRKVIKIKSSIKEQWRSELGQGWQRNAGRQDGK